MKALNPRVVISFPVRQIKEIVRRIRLACSSNNLIELTDKEQAHVRYFISIALREGNGNLSREYGDELNSIYKKTSDGDDHPHWKHVRERRFD